jgi:hypothetical protein
LRAAKKSLDTLDASILAEIKQVKKDPPEFTRCVVYAVGIIIHGKTPKDWKQCVINVMDARMKANM